MLYPEYGEYPRVRQIKAALRPFIPIPFRITERWTYGRGWLAIASFEPGRLAHDPEYPVARRRGEACYAFDPIGDGGGYKVSRMW